MNTTPVSLLERLRQAPAGGCDPLVWRRFTDLYTPLMYYWARRLGLQESDAADLVQDVFLKLIRKLPEFTYHRCQSFRSWLHTVLINQWRTNRRRRVVVSAAGGEALDEVAAEDGDAVGEEEYRQYVAQRALKLMQSQFQPATWRACWFQVVDGKSAAEVAAELGISEGAAYVAKCRVLRRLRLDLVGLLV
jgi:RNA polymerase sigma-70 factor (ECF subfamily)